MTNESPDRSERRGQTREVIDKLLRERRELLALLFDSSSADPVASVVERERLREFCQILVDYMAAGHFGLYHRITAGRERRQSVVRIAETLYPRIAETTEVAVDFNDKYAIADNDTIAASLAADLSLLGEYLATRIDLEDRIIGAMVGESQPVG